MSFLRSFAGVFIALIIGFGTLFVLLRVFNSYESTPIKDSKLVREFVDHGDHEKFPEWDEVGEFRALSKIRYYGVENGKTLFDVNYEMDEKAFRKEDAVTDVKKDHLLLGGCSFIFGVGIQKEETLSTFLRGKMPDTRVVNIAHGGGGLHTQLRTFELINLKSYAPEPQGTYIYFFFVDHLQRWIGNPSYLSWAQDGDVHYEWKDGKLIHMPLKDFKGYQDYLKAKEAGLDKVYIKSHAIQGLRDEDLESYIKGIKVLRESYNKQYPAGRFLFAFYPFMPDSVVVKRLKVLLEREKISYYDFLDDFHSTVKKSGDSYQRYHVPVDGHPNRFFNDVFSSIVKEKLGSL